MPPRAEHEAVESRSDPQERHPVPVGMEPLAVGQCRGGRQGDGPHVAEVGEGRVVLCDVDPQGSEDLILMALADLVADDPESGH